MTFLTRPTRRDWISVSLLGAVLGTLLLGIGSRFSMREIAILSGATPGWTFGGTMTVVFLGALSGLVAAQVWLGLRWAMPAARLSRGAIFWTFLILISLRGLNPVDTTRLLLFMPLIVVFGVTFQVIACRMARRAAHLPNELTAAVGS